MKFAPHLAQSYQGHSGRPRICLLAGGSPGEISRDISTFAESKKTNHLKSTHISKLSLWWPSQIWPFWRSEFFMAEKSMASPQVKCRIISVQPPVLTAFITGSIMFSLITFAEQLHPSLEPQSGDCRRCRRVSVWQEPALILFLCLLLQTGRIKI